MLYIFDIYERTRGEWHKVAAHTAEEACRKLTETEDNKLKWKHITEVKQLFYIGSVKGHTFKNGTYSFK